MKIVKITVFIVTVILFYFTYLFIPNKIIISGNDYLAKAAGDPNKGILQIQYWDKWMPNCNPF